MSGGLERIRKAAEQGRLTLGYETTLKALRAGRVEVVFTAANAPEELVEDVKHYAELAGVAYSPLAATSDVIGTAARKQYPVSIIAILKEE